jgi:glycosyltransferase involved in cell wall biosynthesis
MLCGEIVEARRAGAQPLAPPLISVIIPVYNAAKELPRCLAALAQTEGVAWECIVVDDGSTDESALVAQAWGARVVSSGRRAGGPSHARNVGAAAATASLLCFLDADVLVRRDTLAQFVKLFAADPGLTAAFGSYDTAPDAPDVLSQYRNLLHHFVHQKGKEMASTFWSGCGAIRREAFVELGGFDAAYTRPSVEDIDLGYRLRAAGKRIRLAKHIQVTHLKRWTLWGILKTDIRDRALPWTALIVRTRMLPNDLNLDLASRLSALSVYVLLGLLVLGWWLPVLWLAAPLPLAVLFACNHDLYRFLARLRGRWFLVRVLPLHWLYYAYSALVFGGGLLLGPLLYRRRAWARRWGPARRLLAAGAARQASDPGTPARVSRSPSEGAL